MNFKEIIKNNQNNVRSIIRLITKETNEDLEQEVFVKVWKNSEKYKGKKHPEHCSSIKVKAAQYYYNRQRQQTHNGRLYCPHSVFFMFL